MSVSYAVVRDWLVSIKKQFIAESYLDELMGGNQDQLKARLVSGNNRPGFEDKGYTKLPASVISNVAEETMLVSHHASDSTGFSATLTRNIDPRSSQFGRYTLSFRSTEFRDYEAGGDGERDKAADRQIARGGFALAQIAAMENYYSELRAPGGPLSGVGPIDVTGYSLGGHLALIFTELHSEDVNRTYVFNGAGRGQFGGAFDALGAEGAISLRALLDHYTRILMDPAGARDIVLPAARTFLSAAEASAASNPAWSPFMSLSYGAPLTSHTNVYVNPRHQLAALSAFNTYLTTYQASPGQVSVTVPGYEKVTQVFGMAARGDQTAVANSGVHAPVLPVYIEGQPYIEGGGLWGGGDFGNTHSLTLLLDSLATSEVFMKADAALTLEMTAAIFHSASNRRPISWSASRNLITDASEGDSLEKALDALRKTFGASGRDDSAYPSTAWKTPVAFQAGSFGNIETRSIFFDHIERLGKAVEQFGGATIFPLVSVDRFDPATGRPIGKYSFDPTTFITASHGIDGLSWRHAIVELNPFRVTGNDSLLQAQNAERRLELFDAGSGSGLLSEAYIKDRSTFLAYKLEQNLNDLPSVVRDVTYLERFLDIEGEYTAYVNPRAKSTADMARVEFERANTLGHGRSYLFGGRDSDELVGGAREDHLYGGDGDDILTGLGGDDYLEGGRGNDQYVIGRNGGVDTIFDVDGLGTITIDGVAIAGVDSGDGSNFFSVGAERTYELIEETDGDSTLIVDGRVRVLHFRDGALGIHLQGETEDDDPEIEASGIQVVLGTPGNDVVPLAFFDAGLPGIEGLDGDDVIGEPDFSAVVEQVGLLHGGAGNDVIYGVAGGGKYIGGAGRDVIIVPDVSNGETSIISGDAQFGGAAVTVDPDSGTYTLSYSTGNGTESRFISRNGGGTWYNDYAGDEDGQVSEEMVFADALLGPLRYLGLAADDNASDANDDFISGGAGREFIQAGLGADSVFGGGGDDVIYGDGFWFAPPGNEAWIQTKLLLEQHARGDDYIDAGGGHDLVIDTDGGSDHLIGGDGDDVLIDRNLYAVSVSTSVLDGGEGNDRLYSLQQLPDSVVYLAGGGGDDFLYAREGVVMLEGGDGNDTYAIAALDDASAMIADASGEDVLLLDGSSLPVVGPESLTITRDAANLHISIGGVAERVVVLGWFDAAGARLERIDVADISVDVLSGYIEEISGVHTLLTAAEIDARFAPRQSGDVEVKGQQWGTADADVLLGGDGEDQLFGNEGDDRLASGDGDDVLAGGAGNDTMTGGPGNDRYQFGVLDGADLIEDTGGEDVLTVTGFAAADVDVVAMDDRMRLGFTVTGDYLDIRWAPDAGYVIERIEFDDGTVWTPDTLTAIAVSVSDVPVDSGGALDELSLPDSGPESPADGDGGQAADAGGGGDDSGPDTGTIPDTSGDDTIDASAGESAGGGVMSGDSEQTSDNDPQNSGQGAGSSVDGEVAGPVVPDIVPAPDDPDGVDAGSAGNPQGDQPGAGAASDGETTTSADGAEVSDDIGNVTDPVVDGAGAVPVVPEVVTAPVAQDGADASSSGTPQIDPPGDGSSASGEYTASSGNVGDPVEEPPVDEGGVADATGQDVPLSSDASGEPVQGASGDVLPPADDNGVTSNPGAADVPGSQVTVAEASGPESHDPQVPDGVATEQSGGSEVEQTDTQIVAATPDGGTLPAAGETASNGDENPIVETPPVVAVNVADDTTQNDAAAGEPAGDAGPETSDDVVTHADDGSDVPHSNAVEVPGDTVGSAEGPGPESEMSEPSAGTFPEPVLSSTDGQASALPVVTSPDDASGDEGLPTVEVNGIPADTPVTREPGEGVAQADATGNDTSVAQPETAGVDESGQIGSVADAAENDASIPEVGLDEPGVGSSSQEYAADAPVTNVDVSRPDEMAMPDDVPDVPAGNVVVSDADPDPVVAEVSVDTMFSDGTESERTDDLVATSSEPESDGDTVVGNSVVKEYRNPQSVGAIEAAGFSMAPEPVMAEARVGTESAGPSEELAGTTESEGSESDAVRDQQSREQLADSWFDQPNQQDADPERLFEALYREPTQEVAPGIDFSAAWENVAGWLDRSPVRDDVAEDSLGVGATPSLFAAVAPGGDYADTSVTTAATANAAFAQPFARPFTGLGEGFTAIPLQ